jgi:hypothetical protein
MGSFRKGSLGGLLCAVVVALGVTGAAGAVPNAPPARTLQSPSPQKNDGGAPRFDRQSLLVRFRSKASARSRARLLDEHGAVLDEPIRRTGFVAVSVDRKSLAKLARSLKREASVADVEFNYIRRAAAIPNDPFYPDIEQYLNTVRLPAAWDLGQGSASESIAIVDTGVDLDHPDLAPHVLTGYNVLSNSPDAQDNNGHGTMVAGIAAAVTDNETGIPGTAWNAKILPVKALDANGLGTDANIAAGITWSVDHGAKVINLSLGGPAPSSVLDSAVAYASDHDVVVVSAVGNDGASLPTYPAASPGVIAVTATNSVGDFAWFSNYGPWVDLAAPGVDITSTYLINGPEEDYAVDSGSSFASAFVAGAAFLLRVADPSLSAAETKARLERTAHDLGPPGIDEFYGFGGLDVYAALGGPRQRPQPPALDEWEPNETLDRAVITKSATATISPEGDEDWYAVDLTPDRWTEVTVVPPGAGFDPGKDLDPVLELYGPDRRLISESDAGVEGVPETGYIHVQTAGRYYIHIFNYLGSQSPGTYTVTVHDAGYPPSGFSPYQTYAVGSSPGSVAIGDVTGDGRNDVLLSTNFYFDPDNDFKLFFFKQLADGTLAAPVKLASDAAYGGEMGLATGDLNGDGIGDVALATAGGVDIYDGSAAGLSAASVVPDTGNAQEVEITDMNGDGKNDLVVYTDEIGGPYRVLVLLKTDAGYMRTTVTTERQTEIEVGDLTGDGRPDVAGFRYQEGYTGKSFQVYPQNPDGSFAPVVNYLLNTGSSPFPQGIEVADVTGDGRLDVALTIMDFNAPDSRLNVFAQTPDGNLAPPATYPSARDVGPIEAADFTGDGRNDLVTFQPGALDLFVQQSDGTFGSEQAYAIPYTSGFYGPKTLALGDVSGDGLPDVAIADYGQLVIRRRESVTNPPGPLVWVRDTSVENGASEVPVDTPLTIKFARDLDPATISPDTVELFNATTGKVVDATLSYDPGSHTLTLQPAGGLASGSTYVVTVVGVSDTASDVFSTGFSFRFTTAGVDTTAPETRILNGPNGTVTSRDVAFDFDASGEPDAIFECSLDGSAFRLCTAPKSYTGLAYRNHVFKVRASDRLGNTDADPASSAFTIASPQPPPSSTSSSPLTSPLPPVSVKSVSCVVPRIRGKTLRAAKKALARGLCRLGTVRRRYSRRVRKGRVIAQTPAPGSDRQQGWAVNIVVSRGSR